MRQSGRASPGGRTAARTRETEARLTLRTVEERARAELGMVRQDEVFFQVQSNPARAGAGGTAPPRDAPAAALRNETVPAAPAPAR